MVLREDRGRVGSRQPLFLALIPEMELRLFSLSLSSSVGRARPW